MSKVKLTQEEKAGIIEALNKGVEPSPDLLPKLFPGTAEKFDVQALDRAKIPTLEYSGKRSKAAILAEAGAGIGAAPLQTVRCFGEVKNGEWKNLIVQGDNLQFLKTCYKLDAKIDEEGCPVCALKGQWFKQSIMRDVWDVTPLFRNSQERLNYPTQKPEALVERIIRASSNPGDMILDCFAGSGTTISVAEKLGRRWIACDFGKHAIYTMQRRMLRIDESKALIDEKNKSGKIIVAKGDPYKKGPKPFCIISSGAYDFSHVMDLRKHKETYIDFVLGLFQLARDDDKAKKYKLANIYAVKDGDPVEIYPVWDDQFLKEVKIDERYLRGIIAQSGGRLKGDYYIITPESCTNIGDIALKNQDGKDVNFQMLTFPYKVLEDISRTLELQEQPSSQDNVNNLITSTAFYFNEDVTIKAKRVKDGFQITKFETKILNKEGKRYEGFSGIAMLLVDLNYEAGKPFDMDVTVFAKEINEEGLIKIDGLTKSVGLIAIDKHGNESKPFELE